MRASRLAVAALAALALSTFATPASAIQLHFEATQPAPMVSSVSFSGVARVNDFVALNGEMLDQVEKVVIDSAEAEFFLVDQNQLSVRIPSGVQPGDVKLSVSGSFGERSYQGLFEVVASDQANLARVTIGTFQGFAAVYTKNFKGHDLTIKINERERVIPQLASDYTRNLTLVGAGKLVTVQVFLNSELVKVQRLRIQ